MHCNYLLMALSAVGAMAAPLEKRDYVTEVDYVTKVVVVTATAPVEPVATPDSVVVVTKTVGAGFTPHHGGHHSHHHATPKTQTPEVYTTVVQPTSTAEAPTYTYAPPSSSTETPTTTSTPAPEPTEDLTTYKGKVVFHHNIHRFNHSAPAVAWDQELADIAAQIASSCYYAHDTYVSPLFILVDSLLTG
jgi:hypothetical protein